MGARPYESVAVRERLGYMPEHDCLPDSVSSAEFLSHMAQVSGLPPVEARTRAADTLRHVGLDEERYRPIGEYSTGMKQRVKLAQAIVHDPWLVLLDEPTAGLDPLGRGEMLDLIRRIGREFGISIVLSSHLMGDIERTCDRIIVLEKGQVSEQGEVSGFTRETRTIFIEVDDRREELLIALRNRGLNASPEGVGIAVALENEEEYDLIRDSVVESSARLRRLAPQRHRLSDIFRSVSP
jgi:ABC-2 type transport system ATP-binding protein